MNDAERVGRSERWSPLGGLLFVIGWFAVFTIIGGENDTPNDVIAYADDEEAEIVATQMFALISLALLGWFVSGLHLRVSRMASRTAPGLVLIGGFSFALLFFLALTLWSAPLIDFPGNADPVSAANASLLFNEVAWFALGGAGVGAAVMAVAASAAAIKSQAVPPWLGWLGVAVGLGSAATLAFLGILAWTAWIFVTSVLMLVRRA
jgi:hypothetical protein